MPSSASFALKAVLFDLDGTLLDTAPDLANALNATLIQHDHPPLSYDTIRPYVSHGAAALIKLGFGEQLEEAQLNSLKSTLIKHYQENISNDSQLFDGMPELLAYLEKTAMPWGIVTNKPHYLTEPLVEKFQLLKTAACVISGDQVSKPKPSPDSLFLACETISIAPQHCVYLGDAERDIQAGKLAGCQTIACEYGYLPSNSNIASWQADHTVQTVQQIKPWLAKFACTSAA